MASLSLCCGVWAFSSCGEQGPLFAVMSGLLIAVTSLVAARGLSFWCKGLVSPQHVGSSQTRDQTCVPCIGRRILNLWTTREVPSHKFERDCFMSITLVMSLHVYVWDSWLQRRYHIHFYFLLDSTQINKKCVVGGACEMFGGTMMDGRWRDIVINHPPCKSLANSLYTCVPRHGLGPRLWIFSPLSFPVKG